MSCVQKWHTIFTRFFEFPFFLIYANAVVFVELDLHFLLNSTILAQCTNIFY
jgi:hypothetical protein